MNTIKKIANISLLGTLLVLCSFNLTAQHVIKVKKNQTIQGVFSHEHSHKKVDYLYFNEEGNVLILLGTDRKLKKALIYLENCQSDPNCEDVRVEPYTFEKNIISFTIKDSGYIKSFNGMFEENGTKLIFKIGETDEVLIVREFQRCE